MSAHEEFNRTSSTINCGSTHEAGNTEKDSIELERLRQHSLPELSVLRKRDSTPLSSNASKTSDSVRTGRNALFKIELPPRTHNEFVNKHEQTGIPSFTGKKVAEHPFAVVHETSICTTIPPFHLADLDESQVPLDSLPYSTSPGPSVSPLDTPSMASVDSDIDAGPADSDEIDNVKLDLDSITETAADQLVGGHLNVPTLDVVHQPLPFPLPSRLSGLSSSTASLFSRLINTLRHDSRLNASHIRIQHIISDGILPENYPVSPLVTPSSLVRNSDVHGYFAVKTLFSSITTSTGVALPPGQAHICITERIIPPSGEFEISSFLSNNTDSGFMIRLNELAKDGIFILALPTSRGGRTFHNNYLSKILDPILRTIVFRLSLRSELAKDISNAVVLAQLLSFDRMRSKIQSILTTANTDTYFPGTTKPSFKLISATRGTLALPFESWYAWWLGQERDRIMRLLHYHLNVRGQGFANPADESYSATRSSIMLELEKEMVKAGLEQGVMPEIEMAVFMVQRVE